MSKTLLILTGHSKGLGRAILDYYLKIDRTQVLAISRSSIQLDHPQLTERNLDLSDLPVLQNELDGIFPNGDFGQLILINNAGWIGEIKPIGELSPKELRQQVNLNLLAPMFLTNAFIKKYKSSPAEKIICNISSGAATRPVSGWGGYCSTKAALAMFTMVADRDNKSDSFHFYSLAPGIVDTPMQEDIRKSEETNFPELEKFKAFKANGDLTAPDLVAEKIGYLLGNVEKFPEVIQDVRNIQLP
ncbi:SDR family NAD(P)-dependent oxidoreductase [Algoriphagus sp.]|uniref:SDR family NAD(P)-dependent oxidoreductase n=1 Tax=Algoriphagus sp. TaxID=1872435 RepID=UPI00261408D0|nr:SDR family NAD(P)-dependent oxidoreductase [Algoriphagus sp.]